MYSSNGIFYTEEHTISFGDLITKTIDGRSYTDFDTYANTWEDWRLIPSSLPVVAHPNVVTKYIDIPGLNGTLDLTEYLTGYPTYGQRQGAFQFIIVNEQEDPEAIRVKMMDCLHGKDIKMVLADDPKWYYTGRFTVGNVTPGADYRSISISYQLDPYKYLIQAFGSETVLWDPFNFETDYDYSALYPSIVVDNETKNFTIFAGGNYPVTPEFTWISGSVTVTFGGVTKTFSSAKTRTLGTVVNQYATLTVSGTGSISVKWRGGSL